MKNVPVPVLVLSIIGILLGAMGLLGACVAPILLFTDLVPNPSMDPIRHDSLYIGFSIGAMAVGLVTTILLLAGSIGSLRLAPWARLCMLAYSIINPLTTCIATVFNVLYTVPKMTAAMVGPAATGGQIGGYIGAAIGLLFTCAFSACVLFFYTRPAVTNAFKGIFPDANTSFPVIDTPPN